MLFTSWDAIEILFVSMCMAAIGAAVFAVIVDHTAEDYEENLQLRQERKARQRRRRDFPVITEPVRWEMIDESGKHFWM